MERMKIILHIALAAKFEENFIREELVDPEINEAEDHPEETRASQKKRKPGPLMANTAEEVSRIFDRNKGQAGKTEMGDVQKLLAEFFDPYEVVLRLNIYKDRINTSRRRGDVPLHAFYLNTPPNDRLAFLFDIPEPPEFKRLSRQSGAKEKEKTAAAKVIAAFVEGKQKEFEERQAAEKKAAKEQKAKKDIKLGKQVFGESYKRGEDGKWSVDFKNRPDYT